MYTLDDVQMYLKKIEISQPDGTYITPTLNSPQLGWICKWINGISTVDVTSRQIGSTIAQCIFVSFICVQESESNVVVRGHNMRTSRMILFIGNQDHMKSDWTP